MKTAQSNQKSGTADLVAKAADEFLKAAEAGNPPQVEEFVERYPQIAAILRDVLPALAIINPSLSGNREKPLGTDDLIDRTLGDFRLIREIGRGGMGVVYEAEQISLGRSVALKVLPFAGVLDEKQLQRFKNEARAAAALEHPHIVPVYSVGCERGVHYYAMRLIDGQSLAEVLRAMPEYRAEQEAGDRKSEIRVSLGTCPVESDGNVPLTLRHEDAASRRRVMPTLDGPTSEVGDRKSEVGAGHAVRADKAGVSPRVPTSDLPSPTSDAPTAETINQAADATSPTPDPRPLTPDISSKAHFRNVARRGIQAAEALAYAHEQGILHRDIKPGNLLLDNSGDLWVTDFGLARLEQDAGITVTGDMLGTLRYMSPEQALGRRVLDERSDIYSLGVTLYELLVLRPAFSGNDRQEVLCHITTDEPTPPRKLNPRIPLDLETIILRAIAKEPTSRYQTAADLADDLQRFATDQPIHARRPKLFEKCVKWSRRHPATVLSAVIIASVIAIASTAAALLINGAKNDAVTAHQLEQQARERADQQSQLALSTLKLVVNEIQSKLKGVKGAADVRRTLLNTAIDGLKQLARNQSTAGNAAHSLVRSHLDLGDAFFLTREIKSAHSLEEALAQFQAAHGLAGQLVGRFPNNIDVQRDLSIACERMGAVNMALGKVTAARDFYRKELEVSQKLVDENPQNAEVRRDLAVAYQFLGDADLRSGSVTAARNDFQKLLDISRKLADESPANATAQLELAIAYEKLGDVNLKMGKLSDARDDFQKEQEIQQKAAQDDAGNVGIQDSLTISYRRLASVDMQLGNLTAAQDACQKAVAISQRLVGSDTESGFQRGLSLGYELLGDVHLKLLDFAAAGDDYRKFAELSEKLARGDPKDTESQRYLFGAYERLGTIYSRLGNVEGAQDAYQKFVEISEKLAQQDPRDSTAQRSLALSYERLGGVNLQAGNLSAARDAYQKFSAIIQKLAEQDPNNSEAQRDLSVSLEKRGYVMLKLGDANAARELCKNGLEIRQKLAHDHPDTPLAQDDLVRSYRNLETISLRLGDAAAARDASRAILGIRLKQAKDHPTNIEFQRSLPGAYQVVGDVEKELGNFSAARDAYQKLFEVSHKLSSNNPRDIQLKHCLSVAYERLGRADMREGEFAVARVAFQNCLENSLATLQIDQNNVGARNQVGISYQDLGELNSRSGNLSAARDADERCLDVFRQIAQKDRRNAQAQRDLGSAYKKLGDMHLQMGNSPAAHDAYQACFDVAQRAALVDPKNRDADDDLATAHQALGDLHLRTGNISASRDAYQKSLEIRRKLAQSDVLNVDARSELAKCYGRLAHLEESAEDFTAAARSSDQAVAILDELNETGKIAARPDDQALREVMKRAIAVCKSAPKAIESLEAAPSEPKEILSRLLGIRCRAMARRGNPQEAAAAAEKLSALEFADGRELFSAAAAFALCAEGARAAQTSATASANSQSLEEHYAARAVELLRKAEPLGYFKDPIHRALLEADQKLDVLRPRDDFNKLLRTVYEEEPR